VKKVDISKELDELKKQNSEAFRRLQHFIRGVKTARHHSYEKYRGPRKTE
jgi:hypothetical protein